MGEPYDNGKLGGQLTIRLSVVPLGTTSSHQGDAFHAAVSQYM